MDKKYHDMLDKAQSVGEFVDLAISDAKVATVLPIDDRTLLAPWTPISLGTSNIRFTTGQTIPENSWFMVARHMGPDVLSYQLGYDLTQYCGISVPVAQRTASQVGGPKGTPGCAAIAYQNQIGFLIQTNAYDFAFVQGGGSHHQYGFQWSRSTSPQPWLQGRSFIIESDIQVPRVIRVQNCPGEVSMCCYFLDTLSNSTFAMTFLAYSCDMQASEFVGSDGWINFSSCRFLPNTRYSQNASSGITRNSPWNGWINYRAIVTPNHLLTSVSDINLKRAEAKLQPMSMNPEDYRLTMAFLGNEVVWQKAGQSLTLGCGYRNFSVYSRKV